MRGRKDRYPSLGPSGSCSALLQAEPTTQYYQTETDESGPGFAERAKEKLEHAKEAVAGVAEAAKEKVSGLGDATASTAEDAGRRAQQVYQEGRSTALKMRRSIESGYHLSARQLESAMEEYPLAAGNCLGPVRVNRSFEASS